MGGILVIGVGVVALYLWLRVDPERFIELSSITELQPTVNPVSRPGDCVLWNGRYSGRSSST